MYMRLIEAQKGTVKLFKNLPQWVAHSETKWFVPFLKNATLPLVILLYLLQQNKRKKYGNSK